MHVHVRTAGFLYSDNLSAESCSRSAPISSFLKFVAFSKERRAVRFLLWWLFLHRRLRSRQRGSRHISLKRAGERRSTQAADHFRRASLVFIRATRDLPLGRSQASLSASAPSVLDSGFPLLLPASGVSPPPLHLSVPVQVPLSNLDCDAILHREKSKSSRKHFNSHPVNTGILWICCDFSCGENVYKNVENVPSFMPAAVPGVGRISRVTRSFTTTNETRNKKRFPIGKRSDSPLR